MKVVYAYVGYVGHEHAMELAISQNNFRFPPLQN